MGSALGTALDKLRISAPSPTAKNKRQENGRQDYMTLTSESSTSAEKEMAFNPLEHRVRGEFIYRGITYCEINKGLNINYADGWTPDPSDIMITTYPKQGTTWMAGIVPLVLKDGDIDKVNAMGHMETRVPYVEINFPGSPPTFQVLSEKEPPRIMKTHLMYEYLHKQVEVDKIKVILVVRNPKDTLVSYYHMYKSQAVLNNFPGTFHDYFQLFKAKRIQFGDIFDWTKDWWMKRDLKNVLALKYEDMLKDAASAVRQVAEFMDKDLDDATVQKIVEQCSLKSMRKDPMMNIENEALNMKKGNFYRKGIAGDWKNYFNEEESKYVDELCKKHFEPIGLTFEYE